MRSKEERHCVVWGMSVQENESGNTWHCVCFFVFVLVSQSAQETTCVRYRSWTLACEARLPFELSPQPGRTLVSAQRASYFIFFWFVYWPRKVWRPQLSSLGKTLKHDCLWYLVYVRNWAKLKHMWWAVGLPHCALWVQAGIFFPLSIVWVVHKIVLFGDHTQWAQCFRRCFKWCSVLGITSHYALGDPEVLGFEVSLCSRHALQSFEPFPQPPPILFGK